MTDVIYDNGHRMNVPKENSLPKVFKKNGVHAEHGLLQLEKDIYEYFIWQCDIVAHLYDDMDQVFAINAIKNTFIKQYNAATGTDLTKGE